MGERSTAQHGRELQRVQSTIERLGLPRGLLSCEGLIQLYVTLIQPSPDPLPLHQSQSWADFPVAVVGCSPEACINVVYLPHRGCKRVFDLVMRFGTSKSPKCTRSSTAYYCPGRPAFVPLRQTIASSVLATQPSRKRLDAAFGCDLCFPFGAQAHVG